MCALAAPAFGRRRRRQRDDRRACRARRAGGGHVCRRRRLLAPTRRRGRASAAIADAKGRRAYRRSRSSPSPSAFSRRPWRDCALWRVRAAGTAEDRHSGCACPVSGAPAHARRSRPRSVNVVEALQLTRIRERIARDHDPRMGALRQRCATGRSQVVSSGVRADVHGGRICAPGRSEEVQVHPLGAGRARGRAIALAMRCSEIAARRASAKPASGPASPNALRRLPLAVAAKADVSGVA